MEEGLDYMFCHHWPFVDIRWKFSSLLFDPSYIFHLCCLLIHFFEHFGQDHVMCVVILYLSFIECCRVLWRELYMISFSELINCKCVCAEGGRTNALHSVSRTYCYWWWGTGCQWGPQGLSGGMGKREWILSVWLVLVFSVCVMMANESGSWQYD